jgi:hypothetical protein
MNNDDPPRPKSTRSTSHRELVAQPLFATARRARSPRLIRGFVPFFCMWNERRAPRHSRPPSLSRTLGRTWCVCYWAVCFEKVLGHRQRARRVWRPTGAVFYTEKCSIAEAFINSQPAHQSNYGYKYCRLGALKPPTCYPLLPWKLVWVRTRIIKSMRFVSQAPRAHSTFPC